VEHLDGVPGPDWFEPRADHVVVSRLDDHARVGAMSDLLMGMVNRRLVAGRARPPMADRHALGEESAVVRARKVVAPAPPNRAVALWNGFEYVFQRAAAGPPELVCVGVQDPVGFEGGGGKPGHTRHPLLLAHVVASLPNEVQEAGALVPLQYVGRIVL
jgi:hypothetical protein